MPAISLLKSSYRELRGLETRGDEIEKQSVETLDTAHHQCQNKLELSETRAETLCQEIRLQTIYFIDKQLIANTNVGLTSSA